MTPRRGQARPGSGDSGPAQDTPRSRTGGTAWGCLWPCSERRAGSTADRLHGTGDKQDRSGPSGPAPDSPFVLKSSRTDQQVSQPQRQDRLLPSGRAERSRTQMPQRGGEQSRQEAPVTRERAGNQELLTAQGQVLRAHGGQQGKPVI